MIVSGLAVYFIWVKAFGLVHGPPGIIAVFFLGLICFVLGLTGRQRRVLFAGALTLIPYALLAPLCGSQQRAIAAGGLAVMLAGLTAGAIARGNCTTARRGHEPATH